MASIITATTTSGLTQSADNSGVLQLASGTGNLVTVPSVTGTAMVSGNMPTFSASMSGNQNVTNASFTKVQFSVENWDTANCYDPTTNYRFTPNVAGYYMVNLGLDAGNSSSASRCVPSIYKNGSAIRNGTNIAPGSGGFTYSGNISAQVYMNGTTDYIEGYVYVAGTSPTVTASPNSFFDAVLVRAA